MFSARGPPVSLAFHAAPRDMCGPMRTFRFYSSLSTLALGFIAMACGGPGTTGSGGNGGSGGSGGSGGTGGSEAACGNGTVDDGEECDDGDANSDTGACTAACK